MLLVVQEKANELVRAHALAWKRIKEGEQPEPVKEEETLAEEAPVLEDPQERELENYEIGDSVTAAQVRLIHSLSAQAGLSEEELRSRLQDSYGYKICEKLKREQAAKLLVELGREERERFEQERSHSSRRREPDEETIS